MEPEIYSDNHQRMLTGLVSLGWKTNKWYNRIEVEDMKKPLEAQRDREVACMKKPSPGALQAVC